MHTDLILILDRAHLARERVREAALHVTVVGVDVDDDTQRSDRQARVEELVEVQTGPLYAGFVEDLMQAAGRLDQRELFFTSSSALPMWGYS